MAIFAFKPHQAGISNRLAREEEPIEIHVTNSPQRGNGRMIDAQGGSHVVSSSSRSLEGAYKKHASAEIDELRSTLIELKLRLAESLAQNDVLTKERDEALEKVQKLFRPWHTEGASATCTDGGEGTRATNVRQQAARRKSNGDDDVRPPASHHGSLSRRHTIGHSELYLRKGGQEEQEQEQEQSSSSTFASVLKSSFSSLRDEALPSATASAAAARERRRSSMSAVSSSSNHFSPIRCSSTSLPVNPPRGSSNDDDDDGGRQGSFSPRGTNDYNRLLMRYKELRQRHHGIVTTSEKLDSSEAGTCTTRRPASSCTTKYHEYATETKFSTKKKGRRFSA